MVNLLFSSNESCQHNLLAFMNTCGGAICVDCNKIFSSDSIEGRRAEAIYNKYRESNE